MNDALFIIDDLKSSTNITCKRNHSNETNSHNRGAWPVHYNQSETFVNTLGLYTQKKQQQTFRCIPLTTDGGSPLQYQKRYRTS